jgi:hypothetical protein
MTGPSRRGWLLPALLLATLLATTGSQALEPPNFEEASHLRGGTWVLWSPYQDAAAAEVNVERGAFRTIDVSAFTYPWRFLAVPDGDRRAWLYALDRRGDDEVVLARIRLEGGGGSEVVRWFRGSGMGQVHNFLRHGPDGTLLLAVEREDGWMVDVLDGATGAVVQQVGPLAGAPKDVIPWSHGRWLIVDGSRLYTWPDDVTLLYDDFAAPLRWSEPPPMVPWGWPESLLPLGGDRLLCRSSFALFEVGGPTAGPIARSATGLRYPVDGPAGEVALQYPGHPVWSGDRIFLWDKGSQQMLRLIDGGGADAWRLQPIWAAPVASPATPASNESLMAALHPEPGQGWLVGVRPELERIGDYLVAEVDPTPARELLVSEHYQRWESRVLAATLLTAHGAPLPGRATGSPPATVDQVLAGWASEAWVDLESTSPAAFFNHHRDEIAVIEANRAEAIPKLLATASPQAALTLALLRTEEADPWFRELVSDPTEYGWETGCTYPRSSVGIFALEHLHGQPLSELMPMKRKQIKELREAATAADALEGMARWCGEAGFARHLLGAMGE